MRTFKLQFLTLFFSLLCTFSTSFASDSANTLNQIEECHNLITQYLTVVEKIKEQKGNPDDGYLCVQKSLELFEQMQGLINYEMQNNRDDYSEMICRINRDFAIKEIATMMFEVGKYYEVKKNKKKAKKVYREIITTFTGDDYRSYVKQAEFALEDLKGK